MSIVATEVVSVVLYGPSASLTSVGIGLAVPPSVGMPQRMETGLPQLLTVQDRLATAPTDRVALGSEELIRSERGERGREREGGEGREREREGERGREREREGERGGEGVVDTHTAVMCTLSTTHPQPAD